MIFEIDKGTVKFLAAKKLTFNQFALCLLIRQKDVESILRYTDNVVHIGDCLIPVKGGGHIKEIDDLIDRGFIKNISTDGGYDLDNYIVTPKFNRDFLVDNDTAPKEVWMNYPKHGLGNGLEWEAKACDYDEFAMKYLKAIGGDLEVHKNLVMPHVMKIKATGYAPMKIMNYIGSRNWEGETQNAHKSRSH